MHFQILITQSDLDANSDKKARIEFSPSMSNSANAFNILAGSTNNYVSIAYIG